MKKLMNETVESATREARSKHGSELTHLREVAVRYTGPRRKRFTVREPDGVAEFVRSILKDNSREHFVALYLDGAHQVIGYSIVSIGTANATAVHPRETLQPALLLGATALVVAHNHPSGNLEPSSDDHNITERLRNASELLGLKMLDHVIVTDDGYLSITTHDRSPHVREPQAGWSDWVRQRPTATDNSLPHCRHKLLPTCTDMPPPSPFEGVRLPEATTSAASEASYPRWLSVEQIRKMQRCRRELVLMAMDAGELPFERRGRIRYARLTDVVAWEEQRLRPGRDPLAGLVHPDLSDFA